MTVWNHKDDSIDKLTQYLNGRFQKWMFILNKPLKRNGKKYYFENRVTVADLTV